MRRLAVFVLVAALLLTQSFAAELSRVSAGTAADLLRPEVTCLSSNVASVRFNWSPLPGASQQWLDLSTADNGWAQGSFQSAGPLEPSSASFVWQALKGGTPHFWRVNSLTADGWAASATGAFTPCPVAASAGATSFTFGDSVRESDQSTIRNSIESLRAYSLQSLGVDVGKLSVFAYDNLDQVASSMADFANSPGYFVQYRNLWLGSNVAAVTLGNGFFVYTGSPIWQTTTSGDIYRVVAHEYFHVLQRQLHGRQEAGPVWLVEGSAEDFSWTAYLAKQGMEHDLVRDALILDAQPAGTLKSLEDNGVFNSSRYAGYALGLLATEYAVKTRGLRAVTDFYRAVGEGVAWRDAFARTFGLTPDYFYDQFEAYRTNDYK